MKINNIITENYNPEYDDEAGMAQSNLYTIAKAAQGLLDTIDDRDNLPEWTQEKIAKVEGMLVTVWNYLQSQKAQGIDPQQDLTEFAPAGGGDSGNYFQALASAWYNGTFDTGSLQKGIKSQQDVERLLNRGIVCPDGKTRKLHIDYNSDFDGVEIYSDDYYEYGDHDDTIDSRTGQKWGPYDFMAFSDEDLSEGLNEFAADDGNDGGEDDALRNYARMWWAGDEATQMQIERALAKMGWEIGEDEGGYDNGGVFVVRAGDENGNSYVSWAAEDLTEQGMAEGVYRGDWVRHPDNPWQIGQIQSIDNGQALVTWKKTDKRKKAMSSTHAVDALQHARREFSQLTQPTHTPGMAEGNRKPEPPEADYGADYQDMVSRVKKLAGLGPLKTVYDPQKRVYKNVPTAVQPKKEQR